MKKLYMFDCFGVVLCEVGDIWAGNHGIVNGEIYKECRRVADQSDLGVIKKEELYKKYRELSGQTQKEIQDEWWNIIKVNPDVVETIKKLHKKGAKVVMLSNAGDYIHGFLKKLGVDDMWDEKFLSYEIGMNKPDLQYFQYALDKMNTKPEEACFIDDREANIRAAESLGIQGILYPCEDFSKLV